MIQAPRYAAFMSVAEQDGQLVMWATVNPKNRIDPYIVRVLTTGDAVNPEGKVFVGTAMLGKDGPWFVAHVFVQRQGFVDHVDERSAEDFKLIKRELAIP